MISLAEAQSLILKHSKLLSPITVQIERALGDVLTKDILARLDAPSFDNSAVDGYGIQLGDQHIAQSEGLRIAHIIHAGEAFRLALRKGETYKIMTGAVVPKGVDAVVMREYVTEEDGIAKFVRGATQRQHIRRRGSEFKKGDRLLSRGVVVSPAVVGLLASQGIAKVSVIRKPTIGILITGDELIGASATPTLAQIYDANSAMLKAICTTLGIERMKIIRTKDKAAQIRKAIDVLLVNDVLIAVGGVSVGDRDLVKEQLELAGVKRIFWGVDMKPGKPNYFGIGKSSGSLTLVFGLPGNPVSAAVSFKLLIEPALKKMQEMHSTPLIQTAKLTAPIKPDSSRLEFARGIVESRDGALFVTPVRNQGSGMLGGLASANALIRIVSGKVELPEGTLVEVELLEH
jgi:molybdopterin molybdotransferase